MSKRMLGNVKHRKMSVRPKLIILFHFHVTNLNDIRPTYEKVEPIQPHLLFAGGCC
jgi:hypothetical protein